MRRSYVIGFVLLLAVGASGQWLEKRLWLPDSITGVWGSDRVLFNPINHHAYIGGPDADGLQIFDYTTRTKVGFVDSVYELSGMFLCPDRQRVVVLEAVQGRVYTLDALTDSLLGFVEVGDEPACGVYNPMQHKAYVGLRNTAALLVFDPGPDTLMGRIELTDEVIRIAYDSATNRVFGMASDGSTHGIKVIDCAGDTLVGVLPTVDNYCYDLAFNPAARRLYCLGNSFTTGLSEVWVYDVDSLALLDTIVMPESWSSVGNGRLLLNPATNRLYVANSYFSRRHRTDDPADSLAVIDCATNTLSGFVAFPEGSQIGNTSLNRTDDKVYVCFSGVDSVAVLGAPDSITGWVRTGAPTSCAGWNPANDELLMPDDNDMLSVVSGADDSIIARVDYRSFSPYSLKWVAAGDKLYVLGDNGIMAVGPQNSILKWTPGVWTLPVEPAYAAELNRLYFGDQDGHVYAYDCGSDSIVRTVPLPVAPHYAPFLVPDRHKLYWPGLDSLSVYDIYADSVVGVRAGFGTQFTYNPRTGLVIGTDPNTAGITVVDPDRDSVVARIHCAAAVSSSALNTSDNEFYFVIAGDPCFVFVLDCATGAVDDTIHMPDNSNRLCWYEPLDKLYVMGDTTASVVDCRSHAVTRTMRIASYPTYTSVFAGRNDKLWAIGHDSITVIQCRADSVVWTYPYAGDYFPNVEWNPVDNRVYEAQFGRLWVFRDEMTGLEAEAADVPVRFSLRPLSNPAVGTVRFECGLPGVEPGLLRGFDATGRQVWTGTVIAGERVVVWPGTDRQGRQVSSGVYLARLEAGIRSATAKVVLR